MVKNTRRGKYFLVGGVVVFLLVIALLAMLRQNPPGQDIVFMSYRDGNREIYVMNANGSSQTRLTHSPAFHTIWRSIADQLPGWVLRNLSLPYYSLNQDDDRSPVWSPNGSQIAFESAGDGSPGIYLMNADGSSKTHLTFAEPNARELGWSSDGGKLVYVAGSNIYTINADGSNPKQITFDNAGKYFPAWTPDGKHIIFTAYPDTHIPDGNTVIMIIDVELSITHISPSKVESDKLQIITSN